MRQNGYQRSHATWRSTERKEQWVRKASWTTPMIGAADGMGPAQELENEWPGRLRQNQQNTVAEVNSEPGRWGGRGSLESQAAERELAWLTEDHVVGPGSRCL